MMNRLSLFLAVVSGWIQPEPEMLDGRPVAHAFIPLLVMAGIAAASAAAQGIAGAVQNQANLDAQASENQQNRDLQLKLARQQLKEQQRQYMQSMEQNARQNVMSSLQDNANATHLAAGRQQASTSDVQGTLARAFLGGR